MKRSLSSRVISTILAVLVVFGSFSIVAAAADEKLGGVYGYIIPTDSNLSAQKNSYTFYGNSTVLYFMLFSNGKENSFFSVEIFSTSDYNPENVVSSFTSEYGDKGTVPLALTWHFKDNPSGTYYGRCYTTIIDGEEETIDTSSICKFTIKLNRVGKEEVALTGATNTATGVKISWTGLSTAVKYRVYRKVKGAKSWTKLVDVKGNVTSYIDKTVKSGVQYTYTVKAFDNLYSSLYDKDGLTTYYLSTPTLTKPKASSNVYPVVKWSQVAGCQGYYIYRKGGSLNNSTSWKRIATIKSPTTLSYTDKTATSSDWQYTYTVRAYYGKYLSSYNTSGVNYNYVSAPVLKSAACVNGGIKISWLDTNTVDKKFYIYRKAANEKKWTRIGSSKTTSYTDKKVTDGVTYTYTVRTASATNLSTYNTKGISTMYISTPALQKIAIAKNGTITVSWNAVSAAKGYVVYRSVNGSSWSQVAKITNPKTLTYKDTTAKKSGELYTYTVRAINGSYKSHYITSGISTMYLSVPAVTVKNDYSQEQGNSVKITWNSVTGAKSYIVYRKASTDKSWSVLANNVTDKVFYDKTAQSGLKYYYTVRAKNATYTSGFNSTALLTVLHAPMLTDAIISDTGVKITWEAVNGATSYNVFRRTISGTWETIGTTTNTEFIDSTEKSNETPYLYTVRAVLGDLKSNYMVDGVKNYVSIDSTDIIFESNKEENTAFVTVTWVASGATSYEIYRSENGGELKLIATVSSEDTFSYIDADIIQGATYTYSIKPIKENKLSIVATSEAVKWEFPPVVEVPVLTVPRYADIDYADRIEVYWQEVEFAETYDIYRRTDDSDWVYLTTVEKGSEYVYFDTNIETDITYYYSVKGVASDRDSLFDNTGVAAVLNAPVAPIEDMFIQLIDVPDGSGKKQAVVAWESNEHATLYKVMRKAGDGEWEFVALFLSCEELRFVDNTIEQGVVYTYAIHTWAPDRPSVNNMVGETIIWQSDNVPPEEDTTTGDGNNETTTTPDTTLPDTTTPESTTPETTVPTTKPEETTEDDDFEIPDA